MLQVIDFSPDGEKPDWELGEPWDFVQLVMVTIGKGEAGNNYYLYLCTPSSIDRVEDKSISFMIDSWESEDKTIQQINNFLQEKLEENVKDDPYHHLSKYWQWEYAEYNS